MAMLQAWRVVEELTCCLQRGHGASVTAAVEVECCRGSGGGHHDFGGVAGVHPVGSPAQTLAHGRRDERSLQWIK
jgi:hypothetical protein